jgi:predicted nucleic acid-binding protein
VIAYVDSSVILRFVLGQPGSLPEWDRIDEAVTSRLTSVECLRALDRGMAIGRISPKEVANRRELALRILGAVDQIDVSMAVLARASDPFPTPLRTLDALHLATALHYRASRADILFATHDEEQGRAARATGFTVLGVA